jgi:hypothetical protein
MSFWPTEVPAILTGLNYQQKFLITDTLINDEVNDDEQLKNNLVEAGIPREAAEAAIVFRGRYMIDPFFELFPEIHVMPHQPQ